MDDTTPVRFSKEEVIGVLQDAAISLANYRPDFFRKSGEYFNIPAIRDHFMKTAGVSSNLLDGRDKQVAKFFQDLEPAEKRLLIDEAMSIYAIGGENRKDAAAPAC